MSECALYTYLLKVIIITSKQIKKIMSSKRKSESKENSNDEIPLASILKKAVQDEVQMDPKDAIRAVSMIFVDPPQGEDQNNKSGHFSPQARIILLTILLICTVLGMYTIFQSFLDTIILAVLTGVAYVRLRMRFVTYLKKTDMDQMNNKSLLLIILQNIFYLMMIVLLPWIRYEFSDEVTYDNWWRLFVAKFNGETIQHIMVAFWKSNNIIKMMQIYFVWLFVVNIFGNTIQRIFFSFKRLVGNRVSKNDRIDREGRKEHKERLNSFLHQLFFVAFLLMLCLLIVVVASIFFELSSMVGSAGKAIQKSNNCTFYDLDSDSTHVQQCTQVITGTLKPYLYLLTLSQSNNTVAEAGDKMHKLNIINIVAIPKYISIAIIDFTFFQHKKEICLVYQILREYSPQVIDHFFDIQVTKQYLLTIFRNLFMLLAKTSDTIFSITTFISILMVTIKSYSAAEDNFYLFGQHQNELMSQITNLVSDYIMVTVKHVVFSLALFEIFRFSEFNIVLSLGIGVVCLFPLISTTLVMVVFTGCKYMANVERNQMIYVSCFGCLVLFYLGSVRIYKSHFTKIDFNNTLISLSAVFGLYRFPVAGVFYGPLVILFFRCAYDALGRSKV